MRNWKKVEIPGLMRGLELDKRGYPIPFNVMRDKNGVPQFAINDDAVVEKCIAEKLCHVCGNHLMTDTWLIGGPQSAFHLLGAYIDPPVHKACGEYALQVCPYLAVSNYSGKFTVDQINAEDFETEENGKRIFINPTQDSNRVPFFVFSRVSKIEIRRQGIGKRLIIPIKPYMEVEFWNDGERITEQQAEILMKEKQK